MHPYSTDSSERQVIHTGLLILSVGIAFGVGSFFETIDIRPNWIEAPSALAVFGVLYRLMDRHLWRLRLLRKVGVIRTPDLNGVWNGYVESAVGDYAGERRDAAITILQTWSKMCISFAAEESTSESVAGLITIERPGGPMLSYEFVNEPRAKAPPTMQPHRGAARYQLLANAEPLTLEGEYFSGRGRQGYGIASFQRGGD